MWVIIMRINLNKLPLIYIGISVLIFIFIAIPGGFSASADAVVFYLEGKPVIIQFIFAITIIGLGLIFFKGTYKIDLICILLFLRMVWCIIPLTYMEDISNFSSYFPVIMITFLSYFIAIQLNLDNFEVVNNIIIGFGVILALQVIATALLIDVNYLDLQYKYYMRIPIAASNVIAAYLNPCFFLSYKLKNKYTLSKIFIILILGIGIILTKSRGGILVWIITLIIYQLVLENRKKYIRKLGFILISTIILIMILQNDVVQQLIRGYSTGQIITLNSLSSGRLEIYVDELDRWLNHPIMGNGIMYNQSFAGAHNFLIELLVQSGIVGFLLYVIPLTIILKNAYSNLKDKYVAGYIVFIIATLLHGLIELNIFNYSTDVIFWFVCGLVMKKSREANKETR